MPIKAYYLDNGAAVDETVLRELGGTSVCVCARCVFSPPHAPFLSLCGGVQASITRDCCVCARAAVMIPLWLVPRRALAATSAAVAERGAVAVDSHAHHHHALTFAVHLSINRHTIRSHHSLYALPYC